MSKTKEQILLEQLVSEITEIHKEDEVSELKLDAERILADKIRSRQQKRDEWDIKHPILAEIRNWLIFKLKQWQGKV